MINSKMNAEFLEFSQVHKGLGVLTEAFEAEDLKRLREFNGYISIGHVRYSTAGAKTVENAQPLVSNTKLGPISTAHNGNLVNADVIRSLLEDGGQALKKGLRGL